MKSVQDTFVYKHINANGIVTNNFMKALQSGTILNRQSLEEALISIDKRIKSPLKNVVMQQFNDGQLVALFCPDDVKIPICLPWFLTKNSAGNTIAIVCVDLYSSIDKETKAVNIDYKKLYTLLESAYLGRQVFMYERGYLSRPGVITNGAVIYANMFCKQLNKKYALNTDFNKQNKLLFLAAKFFLINLLGMKDSEMVNNYALKACKNPNLILLESLSNEFEEVHFQDFRNFLTRIINCEMTKSVVPGLTVRDYLRDFMLTYDTSALLSLEAFPYFLTNVISVVHAAYLNNHYQLDSVVGTNGVKLYTEMAKN